MSTTQLNLITNVKNIIEATYNVDESIAFMNKTEFKDRNLHKSPLDKDRAKNDHLVQITVNRVLLRMLLRYRALGGVPINTIVYCIPPDSETETWLDIVSQVVLPFFKERAISFADGS